MGWARECNAAAVLAPIRQQHSYAALLRQSATTTTSKATTSALMPAVNAPSTSTTCANARPPKVIICGAGIGGLCSALALNRLGWQVQLLEQAEQLEDVGAGIQLSPNACDVLRSLGLLDALLAKAFQPEALEMRLGRSGRQVFSIELQQQAKQRWSAPYLHVHRADLSQVLHDALQAEQPEALLLGRAAHSYSQSADSVQVQLTDGNEYSGDLLIGADGIHSSIREQMHGPSAARFTGHLAWRAVVPMANLRHPPPPTACVWTGPGRHAVTYRLCQGELANFVGVVESKTWRKESWLELGSRDEALKDFAGWHPCITELIEKADAHFRWALFDRPVLSHWQDGRVALLGDACHPMLPFMAQGAAMAIEDAWVLAVCLSHAKDQNSSAINQALTRYQQLRLPRCTKVQRASRANARVFHRRAPAYLPLWLLARLQPNFFHARQDWLYRYQASQQLPFATTVVT